MSQRFDLDGFEEWFIVRKARQLAGRAGVIEDDVGDVGQDIRVDVLRRLRRFDPAKSKRHTYVVMVVRRCVATILKRRRTEKRNRGRHPRSLNAPIRDAEGREVEIHETLDARTGRPGRAEDDLRDLILDVQRAVASLSSRLRPWCAVLSKKSIREASRELHIPRKRLLRLKNEIRSAFKAAGLEKYLQ